MSVCDHMYAQHDPDCPICRPKQADNEMARLRAEIERLVWAEAEAMALVLSHEGTIERLRAEVAAERERCARLCEQADKSTHPADLADMIRGAACSGGEEG